MAFAKLSSTIIDSSIWNEDDHVIRVWIAFLAKKDDVGFVEASYSGMRRIANIKNDPDGKKFDHAISVLESPDLESKTKDFEGRRIERMDDGWVVLNHDKFRLRDDVVKEQTRQRVRKFREKSRNEKPSSPIPPIPLNPNPETDTDTECNAMVTLRNVTPEQRIFDYWNSKSPIRHKKLSNEMADYIAKRIATHGEEELKACIDNYCSVITNTASWYTYQSAIDDFFRPGKRKPAPCEKFFTERFVLQNFLDKKKIGVVPVNGSRIIDDSNDTRSRIIDDQGGQPWDL